MNMDKIARIVYHERGSIPQGGIETKPQIVKDDRGVVTFTPPKKPEWDAALMPLVTGGGAALLGHTIASSLLGEDDDERKSSIWSRVLSKLIPLGVGAASAYGGYRLGERLKTAQATNDAERTSFPLDKLQISDVGDDGKVKETFDLGEYGAAKDSAGWNWLRWLTGVPAGVAGGWAGASGAANLRDYITWDPANPEFKAWSRLGKRELRDLASRQEAWKGYDAAKDLNDQWDRYDTAQSQKKTWEDYYYALKEHQDSLSRAELARKQNALIAQNDNAVNASAKKVVAANRRAASKSPSKKGPPMLPKEQITLQHAVPDVSPAPSKPTFAEPSPSSLVEPAAPRPTQRPTPPAGSRPTSNSSPAPKKLLRNAGVKAVGSAAGLGTGLALAGEAMDANENLYQQIERLSRLSPELKEYLSKLPPDELAEVLQKAQKARDEYLKGHR